jgi:hypothetical protein
MLLSFFLFAAGVGRSFEAQEVIDGLTVEARRVAGSDFEELRVEAKSELAADQLCSAVWGDGNMKSKEPGFKLRRVLRQTNDERWTYEQISVPVVSDRDYTMHAKRLRDPTTGLCQVFFETQNDKGPPPQAGFVRIPRIHGSWTIEPLETGGALVTYVLFSDPGGGIPAWLSRGGQRKSAVSWMKQILRRASDNVR